ncbi:MAG: hypothetical protein IT562_01455 [Alphaproteobacteria bacterium]|nr:hypothetical protein [Alphaproteobacteria bacterium]
MKPANTASGNSGPVTLLAVVTKLLAFFVMLYVVTERDPARQHIVTDSLVHRTAAGPGPVAIVPLEGDVPAVKAVERRWLDIFPGAGAVDGGTFGYGHVLRAELALGGIFEPGRAEPLQRAQQTIATLTSMIADSPKGLDLALDVKIGVPRGLGEADGLLAIERARTLARLLTARDRPGGDIAVGLQTGNPTTIALELRVGSRAAAEALMPALTALPPPAAQIVPSAANRPLRPGA